jgi:hypothetical protein
MRKTLMRRLGCLDARLDLGYPKDSAHQDPYESDVLRCETFEELGDGFWHGWFLLIDRVGARTVSGFPHQFAHSQVLGA